MGTIHHHVIGLFHQCFKFQFSLMFSPSDMIGYWVLWWHIFLLFPRIKLLPMLNSLVSLHRNNFLMILLRYDNCSLVYGQNLKFVKRNINKLYNILCSSRKNYFVGDLIWYKSFYQLSNVNWSVIFFLDSWSETVILHRKCSSLMMFWVLKL